MAVTIISSPPVLPVEISASHPAIIEMTSTIFGTPNVTQFRYVAEILALVDLGEKYTVPFGTVSNGIFDVSRNFQTLLWLSQEKWNGGSPGGGPITQLTIPIQQGAFVYWAFQVTVKEQYYLSGVFTENIGPSVQFIASRGFSDSATYLWEYANWHDFNGLENFMPYSGRMPQVYPQKTNKAAYPSTASQQYMNIVVDEIGGGNLGNWWFARVTTPTLGVVYWQMYFAGVTDLPGFLGLRVRIYTSVVSGSGGVLQEDFNIEKTVRYCEDEEMLIMFQDRFMQWAFMSFNLKNKVTVVAEPQTAEVLTGRYRYNVDSSDTLLLNTDWMQEQQNPLIRDLLVSEQVWLVASDGTLQQVTVVQNSVMLKTSRNEGLIQYSMTFRKSLDNFRP